MNANMCSLAYNDMISLRVSAVEIKVLVSTPLWHWLPMFGNFPYRSKIFSHKSRRGEPAPTLVPSPF